ncbi:MAG: malate dehydrogenase [Candidatus Magasanikbacteria bacterium RIFOXYB1_FULL_40_15]|uniref:Malate dehydrogenase n=1 Tax=Candidatus Magasanikbacteria bacterium RIFOXYB1_FULL_40_15 TaxID=1798697 RepID=A0A1F6NF00_9BACT|nr:MAG: malate dehydrogenase [Candidatus Magasanikbacteria bacterium RIFOXYB1_FULL_40_15]
MDIYEESVKLHTEKNGKLEIKSKVKIETKHDLSLAYTPGVAEISRIIAKDKTRTGKLTLKGNTVAVITDGSAILGLGNLGPEAALPVMEGKCILFKEFAGVDAFPICLDTQDQEEIIKTIKYLAPVFGGINLEDISAPKCFEIEKRLKQELDIPVVHDDQHGAAIVILAGLINSLKVRGSDKKQVRVVINGAGAAGTGTAELLVKYGFSDIIICDSRGAIYEGREGLNSVKLELAKITNKKQVQGKLADIVKGADIFIGVSAANVLNKEMVRSMNERPIIFAMANPVPEISPEDAKEAGAFIVASGRSDYPNQVNNILVFPGLFRGALDNNVRQIDEAVFIRIGERLAGLVSEPSVDMILPDPLNKEVAKAVAEAVC